MARSYDTIRDFLAIHYRFNRRLDTPFWRECLANVALHGAQRPVDFYRENGPSVRWRDILFEDGDANEFGMEGFLAMLVGQCVPYESSYKPSEADRTNWRRIQKWFKSRTEDAYTVPEALALFRSESWQWPENLYNQSRVHRR